jgi:hypothetical protein
MDARHIHLVITFVPFICWFGAVVGVFFTFTKPFGLIGCALVFWLGVLLSKRLMRIQRALYCRRFTDILRGLPDTEWIHVDLEFIATANKLHLVPDDFGVAVKQGEQVTVTTAAGRKISFTPQDCRFKKHSASSLSCLIRITDRSSGGEISDLGVVPYDNGTDLEIAADAHKRFAWFLSWLGIAPGPGDAPDLLVEPAT